MKLNRRNKISDTPKADKAADSGLRLTPCLRLLVMPSIASGERKPSTWGRRGCAICGKGIGAFQFKTVGLCNQCRSDTARDLGVKRDLVKSPNDADKATWYLSANSKYKATTMKIKEKLIAAGVKNLREFGYEFCNAENILIDIIYSQFFLGMLEDNKGHGVDHIIDELISEIKKNNSKQQP